jgi:hypothetical protein
MPEVLMPRVAFREQQRLNAADLNDEQAYRIALRRRHQTGTHLWGIVRGLELTQTASEFVVHPGMAVDGFGRELYVTKTLAVSWDSLEKNATQYDVWLLYFQAPNGISGRAYSDCVPGQHKRWLEGTQLRVRPVQSQKNTNAFRPPGVSRTDLARMPQGEPSVEGLEWPVYLGRITNTPKGAGALQTRAYTRLTGSLVTAASRRVTMQLGRERGLARQFVIGFASNLTAKPVDRLVIDNHLGTTVNGSLVIRSHRPLKINSLNNLELGDSSGPSYSLGFLSMAETPKQAIPFSIYRTALKPEPIPRQPPAVAVQQLRIELFDPGKTGDPTNFAFVIGTHRFGFFQPCFSVDASRTVRIKNLIVKGQIIRTQVPDSPSDPRFLKALREKMLHGIGAGIGTTGTLTVVVTFTTSPTRPNSAWKYTVAISNVSDKPIQHINAVEILTPPVGDPKYRGISLGATVLRAPPEAQLGPIDVEHAANLPTLMPGTIMTVLVWGYIGSFYVQGKADIPLNISP